MNVVHDLSEWIYSDIILNVIMELPRIQWEDPDTNTHYFEVINHPKDFALLRRLAIQEIDKKDVLLYAKNEIARCILYKSNPLLLLPHLDKFELTNIDSSNHFPTGRTFRWDALEKIIPHSRHFEAMDYHIHLSQQSKDNNLYLCLLDQNKPTNDDDSPPPKSVREKLDRAAKHLIYTSIHGKNSICIRYRLRVQENVSVYREFLLKRFHFEQIN